MVSFSCYKSTGKLEIQMELNFRVRKTGAHPPVTVIDLEGGMLASDVTPFKDEMERLSTQGEKCVIINMEKLDFIGSSGIGTMMFAADKMKKQDCELVVAGMNDEIRQVFDHLGLTKFVTVFDTEQEAVRALGAESEQ